MKWIINWMKKHHKHPVNKFLHILGPILIIIGFIMWNWILILVGTVIMPLGHIFEIKKK